MCLLFEDRTVKLSAVAASPFFAPTAWQFATEPSLDEFEAIVRAQNAAKLRKLQRRRQNDSGEIDRPR